MFVLKARHQLELRLLQEKLEMLQKEHKKQVDLLLEQVADLRSLVFSPTRANDIPPVQAEADSIITQNEPFVSEEETKEIDDALRERDRLFAGSYDEVV